MSRATRVNNNKCVWKASGTSYSVYTLRVGVLVFPYGVCVHVWGLQRVYEHGLWVGKCGVRVLAASAVHRCIYWRGQALTRHTNTHPPLSGLCHGLPSPHIWMLLLPFSAPCTAPRIHSAVHCNYTGNYENIATPKMGFIRSARRMWSLQPIFKVKYKKKYIFSHQSVTLSKDDDDEGGLHSTYWSQLFLTGIDPGLAPPQMEESK